MGANLTWAVALSFMLLAAFLPPARSDKCDVTVDITDGQVIGDKIIKNGITYDTANYYREGGHVKGCVCRATKCLKKCCPQGEFLITANDSTECGPDDLSISLSHFYDVSTYHILTGNTCRGQKEFKIYLDPVTNELNFTFDEQNGVLGWMDMEFNYTNSCVDTFRDRVVAFVCTEDQEEYEVFLSIGMIISMPFLLATFIAYALLPDRNLHMKALMSYVINLMFGYLLLVIIQLYKSQFHNPACTILGFLCLFFFLVSFFWMNVICIDIWFTFSGLRGFSGNKSAERRRFLMYCGYAWGMSILHVVVVAIIETTSKDTAWFNPGIGKGQCWVKKGYGELFYFYGPMGFLITINVVLFAITAIRIRKIKKDTSMLKKDENKRHSYENDKQKFNLYLKLVFAMGVNWSLEIISWAVDLKVGQVPYIWYITDFCNAIYGVFIFFIFVFKKSIWKLLKKRYYSFTGRSHLAHSMTTNPTRTTSYSTAPTSTHGGATDSSMLTTEA